MIKNIVFDIGNVLCGYSWEPYFKSFGFPQDIYERLCAATVKNEDWNEYDRGVLHRDEVLELFVANDPGIEKEIRLTLTNLHDLLTRYNYAVPWIQELKAKGYRCYYLSNFSDAAYTDCGHVLDFVPYMDGGVFSYHEKVIKPQPEIFHILMDRYGLKPEECVFMDDLEKNVNAARAEGMAGIVFESKEQAMEMLKGLGVNA